MVHLAIHLLESQPKSFSLARKRARLTIAIFYEILKINDADLPIQCGRKPLLDMFFAVLCVQVMHDTTAKPGMWPFENDAATRGELGTSSAPNWFSRSLLPDETPLSPCRFQPLHLPAHMPSRSKRYKATRSPMLRLFSVRRATIWGFVRNRLGHVA